MARAELLYKLAQFTKQMDDQQMANHINDYVIGGKVEGFYVIRDGIPRPVADLPEGPGVQIGINGDTGEIAWVSIPKAAA